MEREDFLLEGYDEHNSNDLETKKRDGEIKARENIFLFCFNHIKDRDFVLANEPCHFDKNIIVLKEI